MRLRNLTNVLAAGCALAVLVVPLVASADDARMKALEERLMALEDQAAEDKAVIEEQRRVLNKHVPQVNEGTMIDRFFNGLDVGGYVSTSYTYNFNDPDNQAGSQTFCQFNCNHNTFEFDAAKLFLSKEAAEPGTAGFQLKVDWGEDAGILGGYTGTANDASDNWSHVQAANVSYNYNGTVLTMGKFETLLGYEVIDTPDNANVTQGLLFTFAIPLVHTGILASGNVNDNVGWALGFTNGWNNDIDTNDDKAWLGQVSYEEGSLFTSLSAYYGADGSTGAAANQGVNGRGANGTGGNARVATLPSNTDSAWVIDWVGQLSPSDETTLWANIDVGEQEDVNFTNARAGGAFASQQDAGWWGVSLGAEQEVSDKLTLALRGEYFDDEKGYRLNTVNDSQVEVWSVTGTGSYDLTENLTARLELRYDKIDDTKRSSGTQTDNTDLFPSGGFDNNGTTTAFDDDAIFGVFQVYYEFD